MANLPTAYASQRFGNKALDFYAAAGEVVGADPRARADERRLQDYDGARHVVRVMEAKFALEPGDQASVLRLQPGPSRRSRPVAVVNHSRKSWTRTHPGANALLSRAGVARNVNWALTVTLFALAALACVWPYMIAFVAELAPGAFAGVPALDVFAQAAAAFPGLASWSIAETAAPLGLLLGEIRPGLEPLAPVLAFGAAAALGAVIVFAARSWRLLWAPLYVGALGAGAMGFGGAADALVPALCGLAIAAAVFVAGGTWNRISDAVRLEGRIALLADHLMTNAPEETVSRSETSGDAAEGPAAPAQAEAPGDMSEDSLVDDRTAAAVAASLREIETRDGEEDGGEATEDAAPQIAPEDPVSEAPVSEAPAAPDAADHSQTETGPDVHDAQDRQAGEAPEVPAEEEQAANEAPAQDAETAAPAETPAPSSETGSGADAADTRPETETVTPAEPEPEPESGASDQAARPDTVVSAGIDADEAERLRTDPRYASRAILLPPPPPMPAPGRLSGTATEDAAEPSGPTGETARELEAAGAPASASQTRTLNPGKPLPDNVVPFLAAPPSRDG